MLFGNHLAMNEYDDCEGYGKEEEGLIPNVVGNEGDHVIKIFKTIHVHYEMCSSHDSSISYTQHVECTLA